MQVIPTFDSVVYNIINICWVAVQLLSTAYHSATVEERVATLIGKLRAHRAMRQVESWIGRTQVRLAHVGGYDGRVMLRVGV